jgi:hypothetical protein
MGWGHQSLKGLLIAEDQVLRLRVCSLTVYRQHPLGTMIAVLSVPKQGSSPMQTRWSREPEDCVGKTGVRCVISVIHCTEETVSMSLDPAFEAKMIFCSTSK